MEIPLAKIGKIIQRYQKLGYFDSDSLEEAIEKMMNDSQTSIGFTIQVKEDSLLNSYELDKQLNELWENI